MDAQGTVGGVIGDIIQAGYKNMAHREGDRVGEDGLLICGVCGTRKEHLLTWFDGRTIKVPCMCLCDQKAEYLAEQARMEEERRSRVNRLLDSSMMDVKYRDAKMEKFVETEDNEKIRVICNRYINLFDDFYRDNQGLLFWGDVGTGKSFAAACIANELIEKGTSVLMTSFSRILSIIRQGADEEKNILNQISQNRLVIFDDFGAERSTEYAMEKIFDIIDQRYRAKKPMIITTNLKFSEMKSEEDMRYRRLYDRIFEVCFPVEFKTTRSWRKEQANEKYVRTKRLLTDEG